MKIAKNKYSHLIKKVIQYFTLAAFVYIILSCTSEVSIVSVSVADFTKFVDETNYETEAETYGWSIIQDDVYSFHTADNLNWRYPNGKDSSRLNYPVTQVSFNDAVAYCAWAGVRLPDYDEYWSAVDQDNRKINENAPKILPLNDVNLVGNVWEITTSENLNGEVRLAGGSYLCSEHTCHGTNPGRELYVDKTTGNTHIGFSVILRQKK